MAEKEPEPSEAEAGDGDLPCESPGELTPKPSKRQVLRGAAGLGAPTPPKTSRPGGRTSAVAEQRWDAAGAAEVAEDEKVSEAAPAVPSGGAAKLQDNAVTARLMKTKMCYFFERGKCASSSCRYAHSADELRRPPNLQKTKMCKVFAQDGVCPDGERCAFAHGDGELRVTDGIYKTQMCHFFERGRCLKGERCNHAHGTEDLRMPREAMRTASADSGTTAGPAAPAGEGAAAAERAASRGPLSPLPLSELLADSPGKREAAPAAGLQLSLDDALGGEQAYGAPDPVWGMMGFAFPPYGPGCLSPWMPPSPGALPAVASDAECNLQALAALGMGHAGEVPGGLQALAAMSLEQDLLAQSLVNPVGVGWFPAALADPPDRDLSSCLANLDAVVADLSDQVRALTTAGPAGGAGEGAAEKEAEASKGSRRLHRI